MKRFISLFLLVPFIFTLSGCTVNREPEDLYIASLAAKDWEFAPLEVEHGEDSVIEWEDEGMEAHVRLWLDKPDGEIRRSDVWNIRYISIDSNGDVVLEQPAVGTTFRTLRDANEGSPISGTEQQMFSDDSSNLLAPIKSLKDLRHFESLQILSVSIAGLEPLTDISGPETCKNLSVLRLFGNIDPDTLEPIASMEALEYLNLGYRRTVDLTPLKDLKNLTYLQVTGSQVESLEPVRNMNLQCLVMNYDRYSKDLNDGLDYSPLAGLKELRYLSLTNNQAFSLEDCKHLKDLEHLETLVISYTDASNDIGKVREMLPQLKRLNGAGAS